MNFTTQPPTKPGFYARRHSEGDRIRFVEIKDGGVNLLADSDWASLVGGEWCELVPKEYLNIANLDWAEDHGYLQKLCIESGIPKDEVEGDRIGIPDITELVDMLVQQKGREIEKLIGELEKHEDSLRVSSAALKAAKDEIERLNREIERLKSAFVPKSDLDAAIEAKNHSDRKFIAEVDRLNQEIERLRGEVLNAYEEGCRAMIAEAWKTSRAKRVSEGKE